MSDPSPAGSHKVFGLTEGKIQTATVSVAVAAPAHSWSRAECQRGRSAVACHPLCRGERRAPKALRESPQVLKGYSSLLSWEVSARLNLKNYQIVLAMVYAIEEINRNAHILPNVSLGYDIYNVLFNEWWTLDRSITWLSGLTKYVPNYTCKREMKSVAVITGISWIVSAHIGTLLKLYKYPQLTIGSFDPNLNNHEQFPSLYQMASKDMTLFHGIVSLLNYFHWNWVGLIMSEGQNGVQIISDLTVEMDKNKICVEFVEMIPVSEVSYLPNRQLNPTKVLKSSANVIITYGDSDFLRGFMLYLRQISVTRKVWIMNSEWGAIIQSKHFILNSFHGSLIFVHHHEEISGFGNFIQTVHPSKYPEDFYLTKLWFYFFNCSFADDDCSTLENCLPNASLHESPGSLFDMIMTEFAYNMYNAVYAVAHSLHEMLLHQVEVRPIRKAEGLVPSFWQLLPFLKNIQFTNPAGEQVNLDEKMKLNEEYDILNYWNFPDGFQLKVKIGQFSPYGPLGQQLSLSEDMIEWPTGITELTIGSFDPNLNNHEQFPDLYQIACKDKSLSHGIVSLLNYFHWNWVGLIISEGHNGVQIISDLTAEMDRNRICVDFVEMIPVSEVSYLPNRQPTPTQVLKSSTNVIITYGDSDFLRGFLFYLRQTILTNKVWIMSSEWDSIIQEKHFILHSLHGSLIFTHHHKETSGFRNFIQNVHPSKYPEDFYLRTFWFSFFNCSFADDDCNTLENCVPNVSLHDSPKARLDMVMTEFAYNIYNAVYAVAHSLHEMLLHQVEVRPIRKAEELMFSAWQLHPFLKNLQFTNPAGEQVNLDEKTKLNAEYDILNYWNFPDGLELKVKIGQFSPDGPLGQQLSLSEDMIEWATEITEESYSWKCQGLQLGK
uniref:vomeronasal type-2 receptor 116-like n=1 Tax=Arvicanthis niloticus TaxID=61156 RepID=UPI00148705DC|nr:vomeronasal type-2 receptor 116-like [Arvicanthis niloticus]